MSSLAYLLGCRMSLPSLLDNALQRLAPRLDVIRRHAIAQQVEVWLVGGAIRDALLDRPQLDLDLITSVFPEALGRAISKELGGQFVVLDPDFGVVRIVLGEGPVLDLTRMQTETVELDLRRRDLTINAIALPLVVAGEVAAEPTLIDPTGGLGDLERKLIRAVSIDNLIADPVRLIRIFRFAAILDFPIDIETLLWVDICKQDLLDSAFERTTAELLKILNVPHAMNWLERLYGVGLLGLMLPEFDQLTPSPPIQAVCGVAFALEVVRHTEDLLQTLEPELGHVLKGALDGDATQSSILKLAALLLEVGSPPSGAAAEGLAIIGSIAQRLKLSSKAREFLIKLIKLQDEADALTTDPTEPVALYRFFRSAKEATVAVLLLALAQHRATGVLSAAGLEDLERRIALILEAYFRPDQAFTNPSRLVDGHTLMKELNLKPGRLVGQLLEAVLEAQLRQEIENQAEAIRFARQLAG